MYINNIELSMFKPMMHAGNNFISIDKLDMITVLVGCNGSGKTTLLKELTPLPSISTDYELSGYKRLEIEHNGSNYTVESRFDGKTGKHSFIKDTEELNISKKANVQQDLCEQELGLTPIIRSIITGSIDICNMGRAERKALLLSCYPSNMAFVLQHYKKIVSEMKTIKDNLKMLTARKAELESTRISEEMYKALSSDMEFLVKYREMVNNKILLITDDIDRMKQLPEYNPSIEPIECDTVQQLTRDLFNRGVSYRIQHPELFKKSHQSSVAELSTTRDFLKDNSTKIEEDIQALHLDIEKFTRMNEEASEEKLNDYIVLAESYQKQINDIVVDKHVPVLDMYVINKLNADLITQHIQNIYTCSTNSNGHIDVELSNSSHSDITERYYNLQREIEMLKHDSSQLLTSLKRAQERITKAEKYSFAQGCNLPCQAREKYSETINSLKQEEGGLVKTLGKLKEDIDTKEVLLGDYAITLEEFKSILPSITYIETVLRDIDSNSYILGKSTLAKVLQKNPLSISNCITKLIENSLDQYKCIELEDNLKTLSEKITTLQEIREKTLNVIGDSINVKQTKLDELLAKHATDETKINSISGLLELYEDIKGMDDSVNDIKEIYETKIIANIINAKIVLLESCKRDLLVYDNIIEDEQLSIKSTIKDKESIKIRLEEEIVPNIKRLTEELSKLSLLEKALSPTKGIPHLYMIRFINNILVYTNKLVASVWNYEMEFEPLKEDKELTFDFEIKLYEKSKLKDISWLSKGQKEMTNLAFIISLYMIMNLGKTYPLKLDEIDSGFSHQHRDKLVNLIAELIFKKDIEQMFMVNHHASIYTGIKEARIVCLNPDGIILPVDYNKDVILK